MTQTISALDKSLRAGGRPAYARGFKALLVSLMLFFTHAASADPAVADQVLRSVQTDFTVLKLHLQNGKQLVQSGHIDAARQTFMSAQVSAVKMEVGLQRLYSENLDTLQRGLYRDGPAQERAIAFTRSTSTDASVLKARISLLVQLPASPEAAMQVDAGVVKLTYGLRNVDEAMRAAQ